MGTRVPHDTKEKPGELKGENMPFAYQYDAGSNVVRARLSGEINMAELVSYLSQVLGDEDIRSGFIEVVDFECVEDLTIRYSSVGPLRGIWKQYLQKGCTATIAYAPTDISYGTCRMMQTIIGFDVEDITENFVVVRTKEEIEEKLLELRA